MFAVGVWLEALVRVTRLACSIGVHTAGMTVEEGARRFEADTHLAGPAGRDEVDAAEVGVADRDVDLPAKRLVLVVQSLA